MNIRNIKKNNIIWKIIGVFFFFLFMFCLSNNLSYGQDLMEKAFEPAKLNDAILNLWDTKESVGNTILRKNTIMTVDFDDETELFSKQEPLIVRITKLILRITMVLSVTMIIVNGIKYMIDVSNGKEFLSNDSIKKLTNIAIGIILALASVGIINLISSITYSSLDQISYNHNIPSIINAVDYKDKKTITII